MGPMGGVGFSWPPPLFLSVTAGEGHTWLEVRLMLALTVVQLVMHASAKKAAIFSAVDECRTSRPPLPHREVGGARRQ